MNPEFNYRFIFVPRPIVRCGHKNAPANPTSNRKSDRTFPLEKVFSINHCEKFDARHNRNGNAPSELLVQYAAYIFISSDFRSVHRNTAKQNPVRGLAHTIHPKKYLSIHLFPGLSGVSLFLRFYFSVVAFFSFWVSR